MTGESAPGGSPVRLFIAVPDDARSEIDPWLGGLSGYQVVARANHGTDVDAIVRANAPDIVIAHLDLGEPGPFELLDRPWARAETSGVVLVVPSAEPDLERRALRAGALGVLTLPLDGAATDVLASALAELRRRRMLAGQLAQPSGLPSRPAAALGPMIVVVSAKGGVGRSTVAVNLASSLAQKRRVALCDLDLQFSDASSWGANPPERTIDHLAAVVRAGEVQLADVQAIAQRRFGAVTLLAGVSSPIEGASWAADRGAPALGLTIALRRWFETVVVDTLPGLLEPVVGLSRSAQLLIVVTTCEVGALRATKRYLGLLDRYAPVQRLIVANRSNRGQGAKLVRAALGASERIIFVKEDRTFARRLVVEGLAAPQQRGRGVSRAFGKLAAQASAALEAR